MSERRFQQKMTDREAIADSVENEPDIDEKKRELLKKIAVIHDKHMLRRAPDNYWMDSNFMVRSGIVDSRPWLAMRLAVLEEMIKNSTTDEEITDVEEGVMEWENYEFPTAEELEIIDKTSKTLGETYEAVNGLLDNLRGLAKIAKRITEEKDPDSDLAADARKMLDKLKRFGIE